MIPVQSYIQVWIAHTIFALPLAIFLLHNFISEIPQRGHRGGARRRGGPRPDLLPDHPAAVRAGDRVVRDLPVPLGLERPARRPGVLGRHSRRRATHPAIWRSSPATAGRSGSCSPRARSSRSSFRSSCSSACSATSCADFWPAPPRGSSVQTGRGRRMPRAGARGIRPVQRRHRPQVDRLSRSLILAGRFVRSSTRARTTPIRCPRAPSGRQRGDKGSGGHPSGTRRFPAVVISSRHRPPSDAGVRRGAPRCRGRAGASIRRACRRLPRFR